MGSTQLVFSHPQEPLQGPELDFGSAGEVLHDLCRGQGPWGRSRLRGPSVSSPSPPPPHRHVTRREATLLSPPPGRSHRPKSRVSLSAHPGAQLWRLLQATQLASGGVSTGPTCPPYAHDHETGDWAGPGTQGVPLPQKGRQRVHWGRWVGGRPCRSPRQGATEGEEENGPPTPGARGLEGRAMPELKV